jgi:hypothetical protein
MGGKEGALQEGKARHSLVGLSTDALQRLPLSAQLLWIGLGHVVGAVGGAIVWLVLVSEQVRGVRLLQGSISGWKRW